MYPQRSIVPATMRCEPIARVLQGPICALTASQITPLTAIMVLKDSIDSLVHMFFSDDCLWRHVSLVIAIIGAGTHIDEKLVKSTTRLNRHLALIHWMLFIKSTYFWQGSCDSRWVFISLAGIPLFQQSSQPDTKKQYHGRK